MQALLARSQDGLIQRGGLVQVGLYRSVHTRLAHLVDGERADAARILFLVPLVNVYLMLVHELLLRLATQGLQRDIRLHPQIR